MRTKVDFILSTLFDQQKANDKRYLTILLVLFFSWPLLSQGPISGFRTPKGETAIALTYSQEKYDLYLSPLGNEERALKALSYSLFLETATGPRTALVATLPYLKTGPNTSGLQDASLWLKYLNLQTVEKNSLHNVFTAVGLSFPIGNYLVNDPLAIGQKASVFQTRLVYQYQHEQGWFVNALSGIDFQFSPEGRAAIPIMLRTGYGGPYFYVEGWWELMTAINSGTSSGQLALAGSGSSWNRVGTTLYVPARPWVGFTLGGAWILSGKFIGQSSRYNLGTVFKIAPRKSAG